MLRRFPRVKQHDITDCGPACLFSVAAHYGRRLPLARIRQYASTDRKGTNVLGLVEAAHRLGFVAKGVRGTPDSLGKIPTPAIAHLLLPNGLHHYVVVVAAGARRVVVMDPRDGRISRIPYDAFTEQWTGVLVILAPGEAFRPQAEVRSVWRRLWQLVRPHRSVVLQALVGAVAYTVLGLSTAIYVQKIVDHVILGGNRNLLNLLSLIMVALLLLQLYLGAMKSVLALRTGQKIDAALILGYYRHLLTLPQRFFDTMRVGEIIARVGDAVKIRALINDASLDLAVSSLVVLFSFGLMFAYSWPLGLVMLAVIPLYGAVLWITNRVNRRVLRGMMERAADLESHLVESIGAVSTIKSLGLEPRANLQTENYFVRLLRSVYGAASNAIFSGSSSEFVSRLAVIALFWIGTGFVIRGDLSTGELLSFYALIGYMTGPITSLIGANKTVQDALIAADRLFEIMDLETEEVEQRTELTAAALGDIRFDEVCFRYGSRTRVLSHLNLCIERGSLTAIVGRSGSGKSTAMAILQKLYPIESGHVRIGRLELEHIANASLRKRVAAVPQEVHLFAGSVAANIAVRELEPDTTRLLETCDELGLTEFVNALPHGFATLLGENGIDLSGGERQRIAIARAIYRQPEILILDEATSSLDSLGERFVQRCLLRLRDRGVTVIVIAHRLATVAPADKIIVLEAGAAIEEGTHAALLRTDGPYSRLWHEQHPSPVEARSAPGPR